MKKIFLSLAGVLISLSLTAQSIYIKDGKLNIETEKKDFKLSFDNRIYLDAAYYLPTSDISELKSKLNKDLEYDDGVFRFSNGASVRRARFGVKARLYEKLSAELDIDFAYNEVEIKDLFVNYDFNENLSLKIGNFKEPMSMERLTSSRFLLVSERPMPIEAFTDGRKLGVAATAWGKMWWVSGGVFGREIDIIQKEKNRGNDGYSFTIRGAFSPIVKKDLVLHLGVYGSYRVPDEIGSDVKITEFRTFPESRVDRRRFVRCEISRVTHYFTTGVELAFKYKKGLIYGEYIYNNLSRTSFENSKFNGWYMTASYMIRGEQRDYSPQDAEFSGVKVNQKGGSIGVTARISSIDLNDFSNPSSPITGGRAIGYSASLAWYPYSNLLFVLGYTFMDNDPYANDKKHVTVAGKQLSEALPSGLDFSIFQLRTLVSF